MLTMRVEAEKVSGSTLVSDNADVGFRLPTVMACR